MSHNSILVSGCAGFIGYHIYKHLCDEAKTPSSAATYSVVGVDKMSYCSSPRVKALSGHFEECDITNYSRLDEIFKKYNVKVVLHLAAQTHVDNSFGNSIHFSMDNVVGTHTMLEVARRNGVQLFIHMSTDDRRWSPIFRIYNP